MDEYVEGGGEGEERQGESEDGARTM